MTEIAMRLKLSQDEGNTVRFGDDRGIFVPPPPSTMPTPDDVRTATYTTAALSAGGSETGTVALAWGYRVLAVDTSAAARVRLYTTAAARDADADRAAGTPPGYGAGVVLDVVTTDDGLGLDLAPEAVGHHRGDPPSGDIPIAVTATGAGTVTVTVTYLEEGVAG